MRKIAPPPPSSLRKHLFPGLIYGTAINNQTNSAIPNTSNNTVLRKVNLPKQVQWKFSNEWYEVLCAYCHIGHSFTTNWWDYKPPSEIYICSRRHRHTNSSATTLISLFHSERETSELLCLPALLMDYMAWDQSSQGIMYSGVNRPKKSGGANVC